MKKFILAVALILSFPAAFANGMNQQENLNYIPQEKQESENIDAYGVEPREEQEAVILPNEDREWEDTQGNEIEWDPDVVGDDELEVESN